MKKNASIKRWKRWNTWNWVLRTEYQPISQWWHQGGMRRTLFPSPSPIGGFPPSSSEGENGKNQPFYIYILDFGSPKHAVCPLQKFSVATTAISYPCSNECPSSNIQHAKNGNYKIVLKTQEQISSWSTSDDAFESVMLSYCPFQCIWFWNLIQLVPKFWTLHKY